MPGMSRLPQLGHNSIYEALSPSPKAIAPKRSCFPSTTSSLLFFSLFSTFLSPFPISPFGYFPSPLPSFPPFLYFSPLSPRPLPSPGGMRQSARVTVCAAVRAWAPQLRILWWCWGLFILFIGPHTTVTQHQHQQQQQHHMNIQQYTDRHTHNCTNILRNFYHLHTLMFKVLLLSRYCKVMMHCSFSLQFYYVRHC